MGSYSSDFEVGRPGVVPGQSLLLINFLGKISITSPMPDSNWRVGVAYSWMAGSIGLGNITFGFRVFFKTFGIGVWELLGGGK